MYYSLEVTCTTLSATHTHTPYTGVDYNSAPGFALTPLPTESLP